MELDLGFKQTDVGPIPEEWSVEVLGANCEIVTKGTTPTSIGRAFTTGGVAFLKAESISEAGNTIPAKVAYIDLETHALLRRSQLRPNDVLVSIAGVLGRVGLVRVSDLPANTNQALAIVRLAKNSRVERGFLFYALRSPCVVRQIRDINVQAAQANISLQNVRNFLIPTPPQLEQRVIAMALADMDGLLGGLDRLIAKKRHLKQAAMHQLLTGQTRLPGFKGAWALKELGHLGTTYGGLTGKTKSDFGSGEARYVTFMNVMSNVKIDCDELDRVSVGVSELQNRVLRGDLLFNGSSETPEELAMCSLLAEDVPDLYLNSFCFGFRLRPGAPADGLFLAYLLRSSVGREVMKSLAQGSTRYNLSKGALLSASLLLPSSREQAAIATVLSDMDAEISALEARRDKTHLLKQGMMQELLTGKTRLVPPVGQ